MRWAPYVSVAKRREQAEKKMKQLKKQGNNIQPIIIEGRTIASTYWGKAWCNHMESFCDYDNRLPRGRTYVRNGSVCHLDISKGRIDAMVVGSSIYHIKIGIKLLPNSKWETLKNTCRGKIGSLIDLLAGKLSAGVMDVVSNPKEGLFPLSEELSLSCDCPDWATMCKHVAAVLYGIGSRLDVDPAQLFKLRGVNFEELIDVNQAVLDVTNTKQSTRKRLADQAFSDLFHLDTKEESILTDDTVLPDNVKPPEVYRSKSFPNKLTGDIIHEKRTELKLTKSEFAKQVGVSVASITTWENKGNAVIKPNATSLNKLKTIW